MNLLLEIESLLTDDDLGVRREVIYLLYLKSGNSTLQLLEDFLNHEDPRLQTAAIACLAEHRIPEAQELITEERLETFLVRTDSDAEMGRMEAASLLGVLKGDHYRVFLAQLMADEAPVVVREAIASVGRQRDHNFVSTVMDKLGDRRYRGAAKLALAAFGVEILPVLKLSLLDDSTPETVRRNIPSVLHRIVNQQSVDLLLATITAVPPELRVNVVRGLNKLRNQSRRLRLNQAMVNQLILAETRRSYQLAEMSTILTEVEGGDAEKLCLRAVEEQRVESLEILFRLLGLLYPSQDIYSAYLGIHSDHREHRINAAEFLSNLLVGPVRYHILPLVDGRSAKRILELAGDLYRGQLRSAADVYRVMIAGDSAWLRACALNAARRSPFAGLKDSIKTGIFDRSALVRETALAVAAELGYK